MGGTASKPEPPAAATLPPPAAAPEAPKKTSMLMALCPYAGKETTPAIAAMCPVASSKKKEPEPAPTQAAPAQAAGGECPVRRKPAAASGDVCPVKYKNASAYNVYGQKLDPANMMPSTAQQLPVPGQAAPMQTNRVVSGIARGGTEDSWVYPSEQMFYNSLVRKGKGQDVKINDVSMMVAIHNNMNEKTWRQVRFDTHPPVSHASPLVPALGTIARRRVEGRTYLYLIDGRTCSAVHAMPSSNSSSHRFFQALG